MASRNAVPPLLFLPARRDGIQRRALHYFSHRGRQPHRPLPGADPRAVDDRAAAPAAGRPVHPRGRAAGPPDERGHADHGRPADPDRGVFYVFFAVMVLVGASNAVNMTDGLDGLAIGCTLIAAATFTGLAYLTGHRVFSEYLDLLYLPRVGEVTIFCGAMVGASMGFLWWNCYPAQIFMGDVGSLSLGGALGTAAILIKQELLLPAVGRVVVIEATPASLQVA